MLKFYRNVFATGVLALGLAACGDDVIVTEAPPPADNTPNILSFSVAPGTLTLAPGSTSQASSSLVTKQGVTGSVTWTTSSAAVATVSATGVITAVAPGTAVIEATATAGGQTAKAQVGVTVRERELVAATLSISSVTTGAGTPVTLANVNGQIEVTMNFNPGEEDIARIEVLLGTKVAATQTYASSPAAGTITLSINTANYAKNAATGVATVDFLNGATTISARLIKRAGTTGAGATNTTTNSSNTVALVLNNADGFAADITPSTRSANSAAGLTYWGGPGAAGRISAKLYPVMYSGRSVASVTWSINSCSTKTTTAVPHTVTYTTTTEAAVAGSGFTACGVESSTLQNVVVASAIDNTNSPIAAGSLALIGNAVVFGSTPDPIRIDYVAPTTTTLPSVVGAAGFSWVNAAWTFPNAAAADAGIGLPATPVYSLFLDGTTTPVTSGADLAETTTNDGTDGYKLRFTTADRLTNTLTSAATGWFGVDKTAPTIRYATAGAIAYATGKDTVTSATANSTKTFAVDAIDDRSGLYDAPAAGAPAGATRGVLQDVTRLANGVNNVNITSVAYDVYASVLPDGYRRTIATPVLGATPLADNTPGYYTYTATVRDQAGNASSSVIRKFAVDAAAPVAIGMTVPFTYGTNPLSLSGTFQYAASDDLELTGSIFAISFPNAFAGLNTGAGTDQPIVFPSSSFASLGTPFDATVTAAATPTLTSPDFWAALQGTDANGDATGVVYAPDSVAAKAVGVIGVAGVPTASSPTASAILAGSLPTAPTALTNTYTGGDITAGVRVYRLAAGVVRTANPMSVTLPQITRMHLFKFSSTSWDGASTGQWVYVGTKTAAEATGSDNGLERFWDYNFGTLTTGNPYGVIAVYDGAVAASDGLGLWATFTP